MAEKKIKMGFKYERKRIKRVVKLPPVCSDYEPISYGGWCKKADLCKNASGAWDGMAGGTCRGGTDPEEREKMKKRKNRSAYAHNIGLS